MRIRSQTVRSVAIAVVSIAAAGCASSGLTDPGPGKRVVATVDRTNYLAGQTISIKATNLSFVSLEYPIGFCKIILEREEAADWTPVYVPDGCPLALAVLGPHHTVSIEYLLPTGLTAGTYRLSMPMPVPSWGTSPPEPSLVTSPFRVDTGAL